MVPADQIVKIDAVGRRDAPEALAVFYDVDGLPVGVRGCDSNCGDVLRDADDWSADAAGNRRDSGQRCGAGRRLRIDTAILKSGICGLNDIVDGSVGAFGDRASTIFSKHSKISCFSIPRFSHVNTTSVSVLTV